jgi:hypothetical protein
VRLTDEGHRIAEAIAATTIPYESGRDEKEIFPRAYDLMDRDEDEA